MNREMGDEDAEADDLTREDVLSYMQAMGWAWEGGELVHESGETVNPHYAPRPVDLLVDACAYVHDGDGLVTDAIRSWRDETVSLRGLDVEERRLVRQLVEVMR